MIVFAEEALYELGRIFEFNFERDPPSAREHLAKVRSAVLGFKGARRLKTHLRVVGAKYQAPQ